MKEGSLITRKQTLLDKVKKMIRKVTGYKEGKRFILDTEPKLRKYTEIDVMKIASIEEKLKKALSQNQTKQALVSGIDEEEAEKLLQWVVQNAREGLVGKDDVSVIKEMNLAGFCGLGQGITGYTLMNMGLYPNISNAYDVFEGEQHSFVTVEIPICMHNKDLQNKFYLVDTTVRQFFLREQRIKDDAYIKDKRFGNKVAPLAGYWAIQLPGGAEFAEKLLADGYIELTEENAKIYGDAFVLAAKERSNRLAVPKPQELVTGIDGKTYIERLKAPEFQREIDYSRQYFEMFGTNITTPAMKKQGQVMETSTGKGHNTQYIVGAQLGEEELV